MKYMLTAFACAASLQGAVAQDSKDSTLFKTLEELDSVVFERSFNQCDHAGLRALVPEDFEFYHDTGGLETSRAAFFRTVEENICGSTAQKPIRKLVPRSLKVFPLRQNGVLYGALQMGEHEFYIREDGKSDRHTSTAKFTHVWMLEGEAWTLSRVLSYDHQSPSAE